MQKNFGKDFTWFLTKKIAFFEISQKNTFSTEKQFLTLIYIKTHKRKCWVSSASISLCVLMYIKVKNRFSAENVFFWEISKNAIFFDQKPRKIFTKNFLHFLRFLVKSTKQYKIFFFKKNSKSFEKKNPYQGQNPPIRQLDLRGIDNKFKANQNVI